MSNHFVDSLRGVATLKLFGLSGQHGGSVFRVSERFRTATMQTLRMAILSSFALDFFCTLSVAIVAVGLGLRLLFGTMSLLPALAVLILSPEYFLPIRDFAGDYHATLDGKNAMAAVLDVLNEPDLPEEEIHLPPWQADSTLELRGLSFSYPDFTAIKNLSFQARGYQKIGVIGMSGAGKSTLINLLGGFAVPDEGEIYIGGQSASSFHLPDWQKQVIYIPQNPYIFHATLRENLTFYHPKATEEAILRAVDAVGLVSFIAELPEGLETRIGEGARPLSGGQAQRIALARALLDESRRILLFDEPTAHLYLETEVEMKEKMLPLMEGRLVFFATHRLHWMREMDTVLVLEHGGVAECGSPDELLARDGAYTRLARRIQEGAR
jgi:ATP-binding cassette subfamily C protein CydD